MGRRDGPLHTPILHASEFDTLRWTCDSGFRRAPNADSNTIAIADLDADVFVRA